MAGVVSYQSHSKNTVTELIKKSIKNVLDREGELYYNESIKKIGKEESYVSVSHWCDH